MQTASRRRISARPSGWPPPSSSSPARWSLAQLIERCASAWRFLHSCFRRVSLTIPIASETTGALVGFLFARAPMTAFLFTIAFPLGAIGARRAGITVGAVAALINIAWSISMLAGPVVFAAIAQAAGDRAAYAVLMAVFGCAILWIVQPWRRPAAVAALGAPSDTRPR